MSLANEAALTDEEFAPIARLAAMPVPLSEIATDDDVRESVAFLAGALKAPRTGSEEGRIKLGAYRLALVGQPKAALAHAVTVAVSTLEWLPTPAELLRLAAGYTTEETRAHARAVRLTRDRTQRLHEEKMLQLELRKLTEESLADLSEWQARVAETRGLIVVMLDGRRVYRTPEALRLHLEELQARSIATDPHERTNHAREA